MSSHSMGAEPRSHVESQNLESGGIGYSPCCSPKKSSDSPWIPLAWHLWPHNGLVPFLDSSVSKAFTFVVRGVLGCWV